MACNHPPTKLYAWTAQPDTDCEAFCVVCCQCQSVLSVRWTNPEIEAEINEDAK